MSHQFQADFINYDNPNNHFSTSFVVCDELMGIKLTAKQVLEKLCERMQATDTNVVQIYPPQFFAVRFSAISFTLGDKQPHYQALQNLIDYAWLEQSENWAVLDLVNAYFTLKSNLSETVEQALGVNNMDNIANFMGVRYIGNQLPCPHDCLVYHGELDTYIFKK